MGGAPGTGASALDPLTAKISHDIPLLPIRTVGTAGTAQAGSHRRGGTGRGISPAAARWSSAWAGVGGLGRDGPLRVQLHRCASMRRGASRSRHRSGQVLARDGFDGLYCYPTLDSPSLDAGGNALLAEIETLIARFPPYSDERDEFSVALYGTSETLKLDGEGRVILTEPMKVHAGITDAVGVRRPRPQVSDLGARTLSRATRGGHREGARAQASNWVPRVRRRTRTEHGNDGGPRHRTFRCRWRTGPSCSRARPARRSSSWRRATAASISTPPSAPAAIPA